MVSSMSGQPKGQNPSISESNRLRHLFSPLRSDLRRCNILTIKLSLCRNQGRGPMTRRAIKLHEGARASREWESRRIWADRRREHSSGCESGLLMEGGLRRRRQSAAALSAFSLPTIFTWLGIHTSETLVPAERKLSIMRRIEFIVGWVYYSL